MCCNRGMYCCEFSYCWGRWFVLLGWRGVQGADEFVQLALWKMFEQLTPGDGRIACQKFGKVNIMVAGAFVAFLAYVALEVNSLYVFVG